MNLLSLLTWKHVYIQEPATETVAVLLVGAAVISQLRYGDMIRLTLHYLTNFVGPFAMGFAMTAVCHSAEL